MPMLPGEIDIRSEPARRTINSTDNVTIASRSRRRPATRSARHVLTVCTIAESARINATSDSNRPPVRAKTGQAVHARDTEKPMPTTISHKAPCQRRTTKSSSNVARAHSQTITGLAATIGKVHHSVDFGTNGAVAITYAAPEAAMAAARSLIASRGRARTSMTATAIRNRAAVAPRRPRSSAAIPMLFIVRTIPGRKAVSCKRDYRKPRGSARYGNRNI